MGRRRCSALIWLVVGGGFAVATVVAVSSAALVEAFRQIAELRRVLNLQDEPMPIGLKGGELRTDEIGLPSQLRREPKAIIVFLSAKCATCLTIAEAFRGGSPATVWFVVSSPPEPVRLVESLADSAKRVIIDQDDEIADRLGLHVTPSVLTSSFGDITRAQAVSSARQVLAMIPAVLLRQAAPVGVTRQEVKARA